MVTVQEIRQGATLVVTESSRVTLVVRGEDRSSWLNGLLTCDVTLVKPGIGAYGLATSKVGRVLADAFVIDAEDKLLVSLPKSRATDVLAGFERHLVMEDVELAIEPDRYAWLHLHGPRAVELAQLAQQDATSQEAWASLDLTGLGGAIVVARAEARSNVLTALCVSGNAIAGDTQAWESLRIERAVPSFGADFDETMYPQEAGLEAKAVSFQKGCYLGQEVVCRLQMRGHVHRKLASLVYAANAAVPASGDEVMTPEGEHAGVITSAVDSNSLGVPIAFAMLKYVYAIDERQLVIGGERARVVVLPVA